MNSLPPRPANTGPYTASSKFNGVHNSNLSGAPVGMPMATHSNMFSQGNTQIANGPAYISGGQQMANPVVYQSNIPVVAQQPGIMPPQAIKPTVGGVPYQNASYLAQSQASQMHYQSSAAGNVAPRNVTDAAAISQPMDRPTSTLSQPGVPGGHLRRSPHTIGTLEGNVTLSATSVVSQMTHSTPSSQRSSPAPAVVDRPSSAGRIEKPSTPTSTSSGHSIVSGRRRHYPKPVAPGVPMSNAQRTAVGLPIASATMTPSSQMVPHARGAEVAGMQYYQNQDESNQRSIGQSPTPLSGPMGNSGMMQMSGSFGRLSLEQSNAYPINLLEQRVIVPTTPVQPPKAPLQQELQKRAVDPSIFRCTLNSIPQTSKLLSKCRLPLGIHVHPFKEMENLPVIASSVITRCTSCRTYLNPFVTLVDQRRWQCNLCYRTNEISEKLCFDHQTRAYIDPRRRPELTSATVEFVAPAEYMLRPPQPAVFLFAFDASLNAVETGYLQSACKILKENLEKLPGDARTMVGFLTFNSSIHFYSLKTSQPQMLIVSDIEDIFIPTPDGLLVNLKENKDVIMQLLDAIPETFADCQDTNSVTGATVQIARKLMQPTGGRVTLFQTCLPNAGPGKLERRDNVNMQGNTKDSKSLGPSTDFYKKIALECAGDQIAIDLYLLAGQYSDLATLSCASRYSSGCVYYYPEFHRTKNPYETEKFERDFRRYLTRPIGFEAVMRVRCTKGLAIHTFHGNCFVRSTDLLSLPNVNPDHSFSMQIEIQESLAETSVVSFQAALLYTTSKGERRIRVHTLAIPVTTKLGDIYTYADQQAIVSLLGKMAVDRTLMSSLSDAREAIMNACQDCLTVYRSDIANDQSGNLIAPNNMRLVALYTLALLKYDGFKLGSTVALDARYYAMMQLKTMPLDDAMVTIYPRLYQISDLTDENTNLPLQILNCSAERYNRQAIYLLDNGKALNIFVGKSVPDWLVQQLLSVPSYSEIPEDLQSLPDINTRICTLTKSLIDDIRHERARHQELRIIKEESRMRLLFISSLIDDRSESLMSYQEFLLHLQRQINN